ncbi:MAG: ABC transporter substrate-binding protein [Oscillospiraceae bacterium]|nr:ABC transporter substrate-binding protein [Oscillospiraceae bacterium]
MKRSIKALALINAILLLLCVFAACGGSDSGNNAQTTAEAVGTTAAAATTAAVATTTAAPATTAAALPTGAMTDVGTPRNQTLIVSAGGVMANPGQFNPLMMGTGTGYGLHNIFYAEGLWDINTMTGEPIPTVADGPAVPNSDFTEWTIKIRDGLKWSDGEVLDANDVFFTFNTIMNTEGVVDKPYYNGLFKGAELIDDLTLKIICNEPYTRLMTTLGVSMWGTSFRLVPEHIYSNVDDIMAFPDSDIISAEAYVIKEYDPLGAWILFEKRDDWADTPTGKVWGEPAPQYVLWRTFGTEETYVMAMINNDIDVMANESSLEGFKVMMAQNPNIRAWYDGYPWATTDDPCSKGLFFNTGKAPFDNIDVRWALTLCCDFIEIAENTYEGIGRMSAMSIPATELMEKFYFIPMSDWLTNEFTLRDGYSPWDPDIAEKLGAAMTEIFGYDLSAYDLKELLGSGYWKTDKDKAKELLEGAGYTLKDGKWYTPEGSLFTVDVIITLEENTVQASRAGRMIADQWEKFGVTVELTMTPDMYNIYNMGDYDAAGVWDACSGLTRDLYPHISSWNDQTHSYEIGERATGIASCRLPQSDPELSAKISELVRKAATLDPNGEEIYEVLVEYLKLTTEAHVSITVQSGIKLNPINTTYWTGFPTNENPYEGPWWWWSIFRSVLTKLEATQ